MSDDRLGDLELRVDALAKKNEHLEQQNEWLEDELAETKARLDDLEQQLAAVQDNTDLLQTVERAESRKPAERAAVLIRTLRRRARTSDGRASLDVTGALDVLRLDPEKRTLMYSTFEKAEDLVGDTEIVWYRQEPRHSDRNSRLVLTLENGDVPAVANGHELRAQGD